MGDWRINKPEVRDGDKVYRELVHIHTGSIRRLPMASDKQWDYLNWLRADLGKPPIKNRQTMWAAIKAIDKALAKLGEIEQAKLDVDQR